MCTKEHIFFFIPLGPTADPQKSLGEFCGNGTDVKVETKGPVAFVVFHSDYLLTRQGFKLYVNAIEKGRQEHKILELYSHSVFFLTLHSIKQSKYTFCGVLKLNFASNWPWMLTFLSKT